MDNLDHTVLRQMLDAEVVRVARCWPLTLGVYGGLRGGGGLLLVPSCSRLEMGLAMLGADPEAAGRQVFVSLPGLAWWELPAQVWSGLRRHVLGRLLLPCLVQGAELQLSPSFFQFLSVFLRQSFSVWPCLSWSSLCRLGWPRTQSSACLCLQRTGIKGVRHHLLA